MSLHYIWMTPPATIVLLLFLIPLNKKNVRFKWKINEISIYFLALFFIFDSFPRKPSGEKEEI